MKFKEVDCNSYSVKAGERIVCVNSNGINRLTTGKTYIFTGTYRDNNEYWYMFDDNGLENRYSKFRFRKASDLIEEQKGNPFERELAKLKAELAESKELINKLKRENALLIRINDLEQILGETK